MTPLHIVFCHSAAGSVKRALQLAGRVGEVIVFPDLLEFGPINPPDLSLRSPWIEDNLGYDDWDNIGPELDAFWRDALDETRKRIVWFCPFSVSYLCNFLEWVRRNANKPFDFIDLSSKSLKRLSLIDAEEMVRLRFTESVVPFHGLPHEAWAQQWELLQKEDGDLRTFEDGVLKTVPLTYFDHKIAAYINHDWQSMSHVVGNFLAELFQGQIYLPLSGDLLPFSRLYAMIDTGEIEEKETDDDRTLVRLVAGM